jgi:hypothetical protein
LELRDEMRRRLQGPAAAAHIGIAFECPSTTRDWLVPCSPAGCRRAPDAPLSACKESSAQHIFPLTTDGLSDCRIILCSRNDDASRFFGLIQQLAESVAEIREIQSREDLLLQELAASWETLAALYENSLDLQSSDNLQSVIDRLLDRSVVAGPDVAAVLWILDEDMFHVVAERRCQRPDARAGAAGLLAAARQRAAPMVLDGNSQEAVNTDLEP